MSRATIWLVVMVSCAHALVHVYELAYPSVEQLVGDTFHVGTRITGLLGTCWRLPFGLCAVLAGWLTDRYGARKTLVSYLFGCSATCVLAAFAPDITWLFVTFFAMGSFASIYHPAGLALISHAVPREDHPRALGIHGIFGSVGIAGAPFLAAVYLSLPQVTWQGYFLLLAIPGLLLGVWFLARLHHDSASAGAGRKIRTSAADSQRFYPYQYAATLLIGTVNGFVYAAVMNFLPRYLDGAELHFWNIPPEGLRNYLAAFVLMLGTIGQFTAGRYARSQTLLQWLAAVMFLDAACLTWMATASGSTRVMAAGLFAIFFFMSQPVYNSLIPKYVPASWRSLGFGLGFLCTFGIGGFGATFAGYASSQLANYLSLAAAAGIAGFVALAMWIIEAKQPPT